MVVCNLGRHIFDSTLLDDNTLSDRNKNTPFFLSLISFSKAILAEI